MIGKTYTLISIIAGLAIAIIFAYYMNVGVDYKAVMAYTKTRLRSSR